MRKKRSLNKGSNTRIAIVFFAFVVFIVAVSLAFKFVTILAQSQFDGEKRLTVTISNSKNTNVVSFSKTSRSISIIKADQNIDLTANKFLAIPIDGFIKGDSLDLNQKIDFLFSKMILNYKKLQTNLSIVDVIKLFVFAKGLPDRDINTVTVSKDLNPSEIDSIIGRLVADELVEKDGKTIQIINGTNVSGLGNRLARLITNIGGDVIIVATANSPQKYSEISYIDDKSYTAERLNKILGFKTIKASDRKIADITIIIGEDSLSPLSF